MLEIGCGDGRLTRRFAGRARSVLGMDLDAESITCATTQFSESPHSAMTFQVADITTLELPAEMFDVAVLSWSL